ncbi:non-hydrolyzing UDP-N-acetylglucosamine 2-epimerase [Bacillus piscicola]|uniref:non-hydrolyzing UDP-N-acetylglucosamine 2-epimerase n=1 Tax=Bacillus piscicola TaxID=1632684 RepID=UPI001F09DB8C|nr:UDP-N-acetylglucosamine 2-epimerase (non-hydrolyzing) [Bacillus piscicola]
MKVLTIFGTRPEGIKMSPLVNALKKEEHVECLVVNTAQHREMLDQVLELFDIRPDYDLDIMRKGQTLEELTTRIISSLSSIIKKECPDLVFVHGDTTTTFAGAYSSFLQKVPVAHIEAGLRTYDPYSPFPEELNRQLVGRLATYHFAATKQNRMNLLMENIKEEDIFVVGNTVIDALLEVADRPNPLKEKLPFLDDPYVKTILLTTHRRENFEELKHVYRAVNRLVDIHPDVHVIFPVHKNPVIREKVKKELQMNERLHIVEPLDYEDFVHVMKQSYLVITDSGGIQEEAPALGKPVLVARKTTERQEGVRAGTLRLVGTSEEIIFEECNRLIQHPSLYKEMEKVRNPYGDGTSSEQIVRVIKETIQHKIAVDLLLPEKSQ